MIKRVFIVLLIVTVFALSFASAQTPILPQVYVDTTMPVQTGQIRNVNNCTQLQTTIDNAQLGDTIIIDSSLTCFGRFTLPEKTTGSGWIIIQSSALASLPPEGVRVNPSYSQYMPKLITTGASGIMKTNLRAHHYRIIGIEFGIKPGVYFTGAMIDFNPGATTISDYPHDIVLDRVYVHGNPLDESQRAIMFGGRYYSIIDSYVSEIHMTQIGDTQALADYNGMGPYKIVNNFLSSAGENIIFGGAVASQPNAIASDIEIRGNHFYKEPSWFWGNPGKDWPVKNILEFKEGQRVLIDGNIFENNWMGVGGQIGYAILLKSSAQNTASSWTVTKDITFTNNILKHSLLGINLCPDNCPAPTQDAGWYLFKNNILDDLNFDKYGGSSCCNGVIQMINGANDVTFDHNTILYTDSANSSRGAVFAGIDSKSNTMPHPNFVFTNNLGTRGNRATIHFSPNASAAPNSIILNNYITNNPASIGFVNYNNGNGGDYHLLANSPYKNAGTDGKDLGADVDAVLTATAGVVSGIRNSNYTPQSDTNPPILSAGSPSGQLSAGTTSSTLTVLTNEAANCKYDTRSGISYTNMQNTMATMAGYSHSSTITGLTNGQSYNYYVRCQDTSLNKNANTIDYTITFSVSQITNFARPVSDITTGWTGTTLPYWDKLDEIVADDSSISSIRTGFSTGTETAEVKLSPVSTPTVKTGHILRVRAQTDGTGNTLTYSLVQGTTVIATATHSLPTYPTWADDSLTLTPAQASTITDYSDLRVRIISNAALHRIWVSWIEFEVPQSSGTNTTTGTNTNTNDNTGGGEGGGSSGGGGGGGGGGGTSSSTTTVQKTYNFIRITPGVTAIAKDFNSAIGINQIRINVANDAQDVRVIVTKYGGTPTNVFVEKSGKVYQYLQINTTNLNGKINRTTVQFRAGKSWASTNGLDKDEIAVYKFDSAAGKWNELETNLSSEDNNYYYYDAELNSFSYFAISEKTTVNEKETVVAEKIGEFVDTLGEGKTLTWLLIFVTLTIITLLVLILLVWRWKKRRAAFEARSF